MMEMGGTATQAIDPMAMQQAMGGVPPPDMMMEPPQEEGDYGDQEAAKKLDSTNIAEDLSEEELKEIGETCIKGYEADVKSRSDWEERLEEWTKLAIQVQENKSYPWPNASNVKFPLLSTAALQFNARAYPTLVPSDNKPVKCRAIGADPSGIKQARANRVAAHMSYQLSEEMKGWEEDMDRLLLVLPIVGTCFKKTYYDDLCGHNVSELIYPRDLVVNYWARNLEQAFRKSHKIYLTKNKVQERINGGIFIDAKLDDPKISNLDDKDKPNRELTINEEDDSTPYLIIEQHTYLDLDDDGYMEPYIVTVEHTERKVLRIVPRFDKDGVKLDEKGKIVRIKPIEYFTKYGFIPNPDGGFYDLGFGLLLGALNESTNTVINQLIDAGSLSNLQAGFIAKGLRIKLGEARFAPGEWKAVNATGDDLRKSIFPLPTKDPSNVLFQLLQLLVTSTKELASIAEIFVGKMPGQNTPASTTMASIEQGMKIFTAIFKRIYRAFTEELRKLYRLNKLYIDPDKYQGVLDDPASAMDYAGSEDDIAPAADPASASDTVKLMKAEGLMNLLQTGQLNVKEVVIRLLEAQGQADIEKLLNQGPPPPDPKAQEMQMKMQMEQQKHQMDMQAKQADLQIQQQLAQLQLQVEQAKLELEKQKLALEEQKLQMEMQMSQVEMQMKQSQHAQDVQMSAITNQQKMEQAHAQHQMKMQQSKETQTSKQSASKSSSTGGAKQ
jgi:chaperonin GroES